MTYYTGFLYIAVIVLLYMDLGYGFIRKQNLRIGKKRHSLL